MAGPRREVTDRERRARLALRHRLVPRLRAGAPEQATEAVVALHATDPATVYLTVWARCEGFEVADLDRALYEDRSLVKLMAMRRTLFAFPSGQAAAAVAAVGRRVADQEARRLGKDVEKAGLREDGEGWLRRACDAVLEALAGGRTASSTELREELELLRGSIAYGEGKSWGGEVPIAPRVLTVMTARGRILRGPNTGHWRVSKPLWTSASEWLGEPIAELAQGEGLRGVIERWLRSYGPGTEDDIVWWLGQTKTAVRAALAELELVEVELEGGEEGLLLADDAEPIDPGSVEPWAALLPSLDPLTMGWTSRGFYLGPHREELFDRNGNAGHTIWLDGRIVGGWRQHPGGEVELQLLSEVGADGLALIEAEAERLGAWLDGEIVAPRYPSPLSKRRS